MSRSAGRFVSTHEERIACLHLLPADKRLPSWVDPAVVCTRVLNGMYGPFDASDPTKLAGQAAFQSGLSKRGLQKLRELLREHRIAPGGALMSDAPGIPSGLAGGSGASSSVSSCVRASVDGARAPNSMRTDPAALCVQDVTSIMDDVGSVAVQLMDQIRYIRVEGNAGSGHAGAASGDHGDNVDISVEGNAGSGRARDIPVDENGGSASGHGSAACGDREDSEDSRDISVEVPTPRTTPRTTATSCRAVG